MLTVHHLSKAFDINQILYDVTFSIHTGEKVGLIGPNGSGKTTLARIITGAIQPDQGYVTFSPADLRIGYLSQGFEVDESITMGGLMDHLIRKEVSVEDQLIDVGKRIANEPDNPYLLTKYADLLKIIDSTNTPDLRNVYNTFEEFGLMEIPREQKLDSISGGQKTRLSLALVLLENPELLILDEPTNHLDIRMLEWLECWLHDFQGGALIISHDRMFLENTISQILDLDPETGQIRSYSGSYSDYLKQYLSDKEKQMDRYLDQVYEIRRIKQDINRIKNQALSTEKSTTNDQLRRYAKKVAKKATSRKKKLERYLDSEERVEKPREGWQIKLEFSSSKHLSKDILRLESLGVGYSKDKPIIEGINEYIQVGERIILTGPNGCGKTTLLKTIMNEIKPLSGEIFYGQNLKIGYLAQDGGLVVSRFNNALETIQSITGWNQTDTRNFLHYFLFGNDDPLRPLETLSYGERTRLELARIVASGANFLILDEPINHLDIPSRELFEQALAGYEGTILAVIHDRYFIDRFATSVWEIENSNFVRRIYKP